MTETDQIKHTLFVMFGPITSSSFKPDEAQPKYTWAGVGLPKGVTSRSCQGHLKVTAKSNQPKL